MQFVSTRNPSNRASFKRAVLNCMPDDGGLYVPEDCEDLRRWILYTNETTSFASIAGTLTSALINKEFSPIICETIATKAFTFEPELKKLDNNLFVLELFNGPTGTYKDFGVNYLVNCMETILTMEDQKSILLDATTGELGACMANALRGKKLIKSVLLCPKNHFRGLKDEDLVWNGGNIYPIEIDGTDEDCHNLVRKIFASQEYVNKYHLTVANTSNIGRLLPQSFFYTYAFSRLKKHVCGDIYYALSASNYGNLVAGLYSWKLALPVNGFIVPSSSKLCLDSTGQCQVLDGLVSVKNRPASDPSDPSNMERLEQIFAANSLMLRSFVYPADVTEELRDKACKDLFKKYNMLSDQDLSSAYAASLLRKDIYEDDDGTIVLIARNSPAMDAQFIMHNTGKNVEIPENVSKAYRSFTLNKTPVAKDDIKSVISVLDSLNL